MSNDLQFDLEFNDAVKDPTNPENKAIEAEVPERYKGKSESDLIEMHINLEKVMRRQGNELGNLRKTVDTQTNLLNTVLSSSNPTATSPNPAKAATPDPVSVEKLLTEPDAAIRDAVESNPRVAQQASRLDKLERDLRAREFESRHPKIVEDVQDPDFIKWVDKSNVRKNLLSDLHFNYNFASGDALLELWDEHKAIVGGANETERQNRLTAAKTVKSGSADAGVGKPTYDRSKLAQLQIRAMNGDASAQAQWSDPKFQEEYQSAYREGRVK